MRGQPNQQRRPQTRFDTQREHPRTYPRRGLPAENREPFGALSALRTLVEDNLRIIGARDYASGDEFRRIDWKASARRGKLQTRIHERASEPAVAVLLNVTTYEREWQGIAVESFERAVSVAASTIFGGTFASSGISNSDHDAPAPI